MFGLGLPELLIIVAVVLLLFGYKKLPDASRAVGRSLRIFRGEIKGLTEDDVASKAPAQTTRSTLGGTPPQETGRSDPAPPPASQPTAQQPPTPPAQSATPPAPESTPPPAAPAAEPRPDLER